MKKQGVAGPRNADSLAIPYIGNDRLKQYQALLASLESNPENMGFSELWLFERIFQKQMFGTPAGDFTIDLTNGTTTDQTN